MLFLEFFHVGGQSFSVLQRHSVVQRCTNSSNWPAGGDIPSCLRSANHQITNGFCIQLLVFMSNFTLCSMWKNAGAYILSSDPWNIIIKQAVNQQEVCVWQTNLCPFSDIIPRLDAPSRNFFSKSSFPSFFPTLNGTFMRLLQVSSTGHLDGWTQQWAA